MEIKVFDTSKELGKAAAVFSAQVLNRAIAEKGKARLLMSTGASQFDTIIKCLPPCSKHTAISIYS